MSDLTKVRAQLINPVTGEVIESVDIKTSDAAVRLADKSTLRDWILSNEIIHSEFQKKLSSHLATKHVDADAVDSFATGITYNEANGTFSITSHDGTTTIVNTDISKIATDFDLVDGTGEDEGKKFLKITLSDGSVKNVNFTSLVDIYSGSTGTQIAVTIDASGAVNATFLDGSIDKTKLTDALVAEIEAQFVLKPATTSELGGVIISNGVGVTTDGTISLTGVSIDGAATSINMEEVSSEETLTVTGPAKTMVSTKVGDNATLEVTAATSGSSTVTYQWYKKAIGGTFEAIEGATANTCTVDTTTEGTFIYYCIVTASDTAIAPVPSKQATVVVNAAA